MNKDKADITIYTDGSCENNGCLDATGGWAAVIDNGKEQLRLSAAVSSDGHLPVTNQRMELLAVIESLKVSSIKMSTIHLYTDSSYVKNGATEWLQGWKTKGWKNSGGKPVKNVDLWEVLDELLGELDVSFRKVKAHTGDLMNELADTLASAASGEALKITKHPSGAAN